MQTGMESRLADTEAMDAALERLRHDLLATPDVEDQGEIGACHVIDFASLEFEVERMRKRLAIWEIFVSYMRDGARSWPDLQRSLTKEDFDEIVTICDGIPLRDLMLDMG